MDSLELKLYIIENKKHREVLEGIGCFNIIPHKKHYSFSTPANTKPTSTVLRKSDLKIKIFADNPKNIKGDIYNLCMYLNDLTFGESVRFIHQILGLKYDGFTNDPVKKKDILDMFKKASGGHEKRKELILYSQEQIDAIGYQKGAILSWVKEGIIPPTQEEFGIGISLEKNRIIIPHRYWDRSKNAFIGVTGRTLNPQYKLLGIAKYLPILPREEFPKHVDLYGLYENYDYIKEAGYVNIFESQKSVLKRHSRLDKTGTALGCHSIQDEQVDILLALDVDIIVQLDKDVSIYEVWEICDKFYDKRKVYYVWDELGLLGEKESPADKLEKIYKVLWNRKKEYTEVEHKKYLEWLEGGNKSNG